MRQSPAWHVITARLLTLPYAAPALASGAGLPSVPLVVTEPSYDPASDRDLVAAALRRERRAMDELTRRLHCIPRFVDRINLRFGRCLDRDEVADVVQDVAVVVLRNLDRFHGRVPLEAWLHRICFLTLRNRMRKRRAAPVPLGDAAGELAATAPDDAALRAEVLAVLEQLGGLEADILSMRHVEGLSFDAIAARLGDAVATTKTRYYRAIRRLQARVRDAKEPRLATPVTGSRGRTEDADDS
jgi:RNA polymerase sigma-70 factor (ECF subfamily)